MGQGVKFIAYFAAFCCLAGLSCWATEHSLYMLLPQVGNNPVMTKIFAWGLTISFFMMASIGFKLVVDSLSSKTYMANRKQKLIGGILMLVVFWLIFGMPTNTHTFFYHWQIKSVVTDDIETTDKYLQQIIDKGSGTTPEYDAEGKEMFNKVMSLRKRLVDQFNGDEVNGRRGNGPIVRSYLDSINKTLHSQIAEHPVANSADPMILAYYQREITKALNSALKPHTISDKSVAEARKLRGTFAQIRDSIQNDLSVGYLSQDKINQIIAYLDKGYTLIKNNKDFVTFPQNTDDYSTYAYYNGEVRTARCKSVINVFFVDFMQGKYPGTFWYYILLSIMLDVSAFIFFSLAFQKRNNI